MSKKDRPEPGIEKDSGLRRTKCTGNCTAKTKYYEGHPRLFIWACRYKRICGECPLGRGEEYDI